MNQRVYQIGAAKAFWKVAVGGLLLVWAGGPAVSAAAGRIWSAEETEHLLRTLTESPRPYWIQAGLIRARHLDYRQADDWLAQTEVTIVFDGRQFRWEIVLQNDETQPAAPRSAGQKPLQIPDKGANRNRVFAWDGRQYIRYYPNTEYAVVSEQPDASMLVLRGPLTAGIVPWGCGDYNLQALLSKRPTVQEETWDGRAVIRLGFSHQTLTMPIRCEIVLEPGRQYAVLSQVLENEAARIATDYSDYFQAGGQWIPKIIRTERYAKSSGSEELISYEDWVFTDVQVSAPPAESFEVRFKEGTLVEVQPGGGGESLLYYSRERADISGLLAEKIAVDEDESSQSRQNCASLAVHLLKRRFSQSVLPDSEPAAAAASAEKLTSLYELKQNLERAGLYCLAVQTDIDALREVSGCGIIVHLPKLQHYVIVDRVDERSVWTIDLSSRKFYWKWRIADFVRDWKEGTALLVADAPTRLPSRMRMLEPMRLYEIWGGDGSEYEDYSCTEKIQAEDWIPCPQPIGGFLCNGLLYLFYERYGCAEDETGGFCEGVPMGGTTASPCVNDPYYQGFCKVSVWYITYIRACK
ncbi:MAG TPA: cysteine peptidase family C39 domain-containing protein [Anaerohalosphaeraceae bacterium]|nr:cysteine peptidase family C39 domain-containing protein [Anaerohalosphaeraceae bacterium]